MDKDKVKLEAIDYAFKNECVSKDVISAYMYGYSSGHLDKKHEFILDNYKIHEVLTIFKDKLTNEDTKKAIYRSLIVKCVDELINNSSFEELESVFNIKKEELNNNVIRLEATLNVNS